MIKYYTGYCIAQLAEEMAEGLKVTPQDTAWRYGLSFKIASLYVTIASQTTTPAQQPTHELDRLLHPRAARFRQTAYSSNEYLTHIKQIGAEIMEDKQPTVTDIMCAYNIGRPAANLWLQAAQEWGIFQHPKFQDDKKVA